MAFKTTDALVLTRDYDPRTGRQTINGQQYVLHCHHYTTLMTQLADDCGMLDGRRLLSEVAEDTFYSVLNTYFQENGVTEMRKRIQAAEELYSAMGLGELDIQCAGPDSGEAELPLLHVDAGWAKKFGQRERPVNFITSGYLAGAFAAIYGAAPRTYTVNETRSIVSGAPTSRFEIVRS